VTSVCLNANRALAIFQISQSKMPSNLPSPDWCGRTISDGKPSNFLLGIVSVMTLPARSVVTGPGPSLHHGGSGRLNHALGCRDGQPILRTTRLFPRHAALDGHVAAYSSGRLHRAGLAQNEERGRAGREARG